MAAHVSGYRGALLVSGADAIALASPFGWHLSRLLMAASAAVGIPVSLAARVPAQAGVAGAGPKSLRARLAEALLAPLQEFLARPGAAPILAFVALFRMGEAMAGVRRRWA